DQRKDDHPRLSVRTGKLARVLAGLPFSKRPSDLSGRPDLNRRSLGPQPEDNDCHMRPTASLTSHPSTVADELDALDVSVGTKAVPRRFLKLPRGLTPRKALGPGSATSAATDQKPCATRAQDGGTALYRDEEWPLTPILPVNASFGWGRSRSLRCWP